MTTTRIENSDRGITVNKGLAWTMVCGLVLVGLWIGTNVATMTTQMDEFARTSLGATQARAAIESRVSKLEIAAAQSSIQYENLFQGITELKADQRESNSLLRQLLNERSQP